MNWFKKSQTADDTPRVPKNPDNLFIFRLVAVGYILYMVWQCVQSYLEGGEGTPSLTVVILTCTLLGGGAIALGFVSYRSWKVAKAAYQAYLAEEAAAEAAASKDEWSDEDWDVDPDQIAQDTEKEDSL